MWRPHYLKPYLILTLWPGCRVKTHSRSGRGGGGTAAKVAAVTGHCLYMFTCRHVACVCLLYNRAPQCQLFCFEFALFSHCVMIQFCEFLIKLLKSLLQQRAVNLFFYLISELLYNNFMSNKYPSATTAHNIIPASTTEYT